MHSPATSHCRLESARLLNALPDRVMLDGHDPWCQQLELLLYLEPVTTSGHLDAIMEDRAKGITLKSPA